MLYWFSASFKGFLITFGHFYFKQYSATRRKCPTQLRYAHSLVTSRGPVPAAGRGRKRICPPILSSSSEL